MSINHVLISGNLTRDAESRQTKGGSTVVTFGMAVNDRRKNQQTGEWENVPNFVDCVMFGNYGAAIFHDLVKGTKVFVDGKLSYSSWEKDGERRSKLEVVVNDLDFARSGGNGGSQQRTQSRAAAHGGRPQQQAFDADIPF